MIPLGRRNSSKKNSGVYKVHYSTWFQVYLASFSKGDMSTKNVSFFTAPLRSEEKRKGRRKKREEKKKKETKNKGGQKGEMGIKKKMNLTYSV